MKRKRKREREMIKVRNDEQKKARVQQQQKYRDNKRERMGEAAYLAENARYERERYRGERRQWGSQGLKAKSLTPFVKGYIVLQKRIRRNNWRRWQQ